MSHEVSQFSNEQNSIALNRHNCGSECQIVEQPLTGEFTKDIRDNWDKEEFAGASSPSGRDNFKKKLWEACDIIDEVKAINAELLKIKHTIQNESDRLDAQIEEGKHDDAWPKPEYIKNDDWTGMIAEQSIYHRILNLFEVAIAKAEKG